MNTPPVAVLGAGSWGTALAMLIARHGRHVSLYARDTTQARRMQDARENHPYLPNIRFPDHLNVCAGMPEEISGIVVALPCHAAEDVLPHLAGLRADIPVIAACKGLYPQTMARVDEMFSQYVGKQRTALLSGPSFAQEVAKGLPTAVTMAAYDIQVAIQAASLFDDANFRIYTSTDVAGVALGGALKNVIAIAAGIVDGLELGHNAMAALITRGLAEMSRLAEACGAQPETMQGLSGMGDLVLTCTGDLSRNRCFGKKLAQGMDTRTAAAEIGQQIEGITTARAASELADRHKVDVPIMQAVHQVLGGQCSPADAVQALLSRPEKTEISTRY